MDKTILFDLDGVLTLPEESFSVFYTSAKGYDITPFTHFFQSEWTDFVTGQKDLLQHIEDNPSFWKWDQPPRQLLDYWFEKEDVKNHELLEMVRTVRSNGTKCFIATEQEKYRTQYVRDRMFKDEFDGIYSTSEIGFRKNDIRFYQAIIEALHTKADDLIFFDDSESKVSTALSLGINAYLYRNIDDVRRVIRI